MVKKRHHAVPQFYLRRFIDDGGMLWLHDIDTEVAVRAAPSDVTVERYLYAPGTGEDPHNDALEDFLGRYVEGPAAAALNMLAAGETLSEEHRQRVAVFLAFQEFRIPRMRDSVAAFVTEIGERILTMSASQPDYIRRTFKEMGEELSEDDLAKMVEGINEGAFGIEATKATWLRSMVEVSAEIAQLIYNMPWAVIDAPEGFEFITSDAPVVKVLTDQSVPRMYAGGWLSPSAETTFALDPLRCLVIRPDGTAGRYPGRTAWCRDVNARLVRQANRFVVSRSRSPFVEAIAKRRNRPRRSGARAQSTNDE